MLLLNADYRPLSHFPLSVIPWQEAIKAVFSGKAEAVDYYDDYVHSPNLAMKLPSVIVLKEFVHFKGGPAFNRFNLYLRDMFECQYCGVKGRVRGLRDGVPLTFDHVLPRCKGGDTSWENIVACCQNCNSKKGGRTPEQAHMPLKEVPHKPGYWELLRKAHQLETQEIHESWQKYLAVTS